MDPYVWLTVFSAAVVQGLAGVGFAMLCVPVLALIDPGLVPGSMLVGMLGLSVLMAASERHAVVPRHFLFLLPGLLGGSAAGAVFLGLLPQQLLGLTLGVLVLLAVVVSIAGIRARLTNANLLGTAFGAGLMGTVSGIHGPPLAVLYANQSPPMARATIAWVFVLGSIMSLTALAFAGRFGWHQLERGLWLLLPAIGGFLMARLLRPYLPAQSVRLVMLGLTGIAALILVLKSI